MILPSELIARLFLAPALQSSIASPSMLCLRGVLGDEPSVFFEDDLGESGLSGDSVEEASLGDNGDAACPDGYGLATVLTGCGLVSFEDHFGKEVGTATLAEP